MMNNSLIDKDNCSTHDPCGPYGFCHDDSNGQGTCICKFWWQGTLCNTLSRGGKQVIGLGIITALLVAFYYSLALNQWVVKKRREPTKNQPKSTIRSVHRKSPTPITPNRILKWIRGIATLILAILALIIKEVLLKRIHREIVDKHNHKQPLFYNPPSICRLIYMREEFNMFTFPLACLLILLFTVTTKRKSSNQKSYCYGYLAIPIPLDFFAHFKRTFAAMTFGIVADQLANFANQFINGNRSSFGDGVIGTYLMQIVRVLIIGFHCYPILAAVYIDTRLTLICATLYAWFDFSLTVGFNGICRNSYYSTEDDYNKTLGIDTLFYLAYYGTGWKLIFFQLLTEVPRYFFLAYICVELPILFFKRIKYSEKLIGENLTREQKNLLYSSLPNSMESRYVANLFGLTEKTKSVNRIMRLFRWIYTWRDDFRFSSRVFCVYASIFLLLYSITVQACVQVLPYLSELSHLNQTFILGARTKAVRSSNSTPTGDFSFDFHLPNFVIPYLCAICTALMVTTIQLLVLLVSIRRNLLQAFRGDDSEIPQRNAKENVDYACNNIHFAGYLIGYVLWGYVVMAFFAMIVGLGIDLLITYRMVELVESALKIIIPSILLATFQYYMNQILGQYVFLQRAGEVLSINHQRILMVYLYFNFFLDAFLGFISSIIRVVKSAAGGILYMCRLDYSSLGRKLETYEAGFSAYCGFIHMECAHRHPVLLYFTSLLIREQLYGTQETRRSMARRRWYLAIFLLRNPTLIYRRKRAFVQSQTDEMKLMLIARRNVKTISTEEPPATVHVQETTA